jgi:hypothetical protein
LDRGGGGNSPTNLTIGQLAFILKTMMHIIKYLKKLVLIVGFIYSLSSCDPSCSETMQISNNTDSTLTIIVEKKGNFPDDSAFYYRYQWDNKDSYKIIGDSLLVVECDVKKNEKLTLLYFGPLGTVDELLTKEDGEYWLNEISDTIYLKNYTMKKNINDFNNWNISVKHFKYGGGESLFDFILTQEDIE